ncbi:uncharacterized protein SCHCODRAFT_01038870 [Schizophyllum commune H4-8]|uniref:Uncharacterized protein n=1 Tax=Schizophyllum commune (strain H4-8 / FGSC 9210) TaxID=578458 RepID=D8Q986_SCHCM|nr:uncharacterized protein SCHCODRAFT_01038870 [Schizophyllum commune H4-8]KAI5890511.1 hypothetical protein SCHCODRAFT_01038870 [Schizophyllum commune H4-8]
MQETAGKVGQMKVDAGRRGGGKRGGNNRISGRTLALFLTITIASSLTAGCLAVSQS